MLVSQDGTLKICDFGMVCPVDAPNTKRHGTEMYMAPEIHNKRSDGTYLGTPADIFSLGVMLWILHFGSPPFSSTSTSDRNYSVLCRNPDAFWRLHPTVRKYQGLIDEDFKSLLISMLSKEVSSRPVSVADLMAHPYFSKDGFSASDSEQ